MWRRPGTRHNKSCNSIEISSMQRRYLELPRSHTLEKHCMLCHQSIQKLSNMACKDSAYMLRDCGDTSSRLSPPSARALAAYSRCRRAGDSNNPRKQAGVWLEARAQHLHQPMGWSSRWGSEPEIFPHSILRLHELILGDHSSLNYFVSLHWMDTSLLLYMRDSW